MRCKAWGPGPRRARTGEAAVTPGRRSARDGRRRPRQHRLRPSSVAAPLCSSARRSVPGGLERDRLRAGEHTPSRARSFRSPPAALRVVSKRKGLGRSDRLEAPFVGRESELRLLKDLFHATAREERARLVSITGQAGIGKSRLAWEFLKYVDGVVEGVWWHDGRSPAYGEGATSRARWRDASGYRAGLPRPTTRRLTEPRSRRWSPSTHPRRGRAPPDRSPFSPCSAPAMQRLWSRRVIPCLADVLRAARLDRAR